MKFDIDAARSAGYSDDEIAEFLATENKFDLGGALSSGYTSRDVIDFLTTSAPAASKAPAPAPAKTAPAVDAPVTDFTAAATDMNGTPPAATPSKPSPFLARRGGSVLEGYQPTEAEKSAERERRLGYGAGPISQKTAAKADAVRSGLEETADPTVKKVASAMDKQKTPSIGGLVARAKNQERIQGGDRSAERRQFAEENPNLGALGAGAATTVAGVINAPNVAADFVNQSVVNPVLRAVGLPELDRMPTMAGTDYLMKSAADFMPSIGDKSMEGAWNRDEFGKWLGVKLSANAIPMAQSLYAAFNPALRAALLPSMGATAAGQSFVQGDDSRVAVAKGLVEAGTEMLPLAAFDKIGDVLKGMGPSKSSAVLAVAGQRLLQAGGDLTAAQLVNAIEETAAQFGENVLDKYFQGKDVELTDKLGEAAVLGAAGGAVMTAPRAASTLRGDLEPSRQVERELSDLLNGGQFTQQGIDQSVSDALRTESITGNINPAATTMADFSGDNSPTTQAGLPRIVVPMGGADVGVEDGAAGVSAGGAGRPGADAGAGVGNGGPDPLLGARVGGDPAVVDALGAAAAPVPVTDAQPAAGLTPRTNPAARTSDADLLARVEGGAPAAAPAAPEQATSQPSETWFGRRGDGYLTQADAEQALDGRRRRSPGLSWGVEQMPNGKFRLAGYSAPQTSAATQTSATPEKPASAPSVQPVAMSGKEWVAADQQTRTTATQITFAKGELGAVKVADRKALATRYDIAEQDDGSTVYTLKKTTDGQQAAPQGQAMAQPAAVTAAPVQAPQLGGAVSSGSGSAPTISVGAAQVSGANPAAIQRDLAIIQDSHLKRLKQPVKLEVVAPSESRTGLAARVAEIFSAPITFVRAKSGKMGFNGVEVGGRLYIAEDGENAPVAVAMHEVGHTLPADIKGEMIRGVMQTVTPQQRQRFLEEFSGYAKDTPEEQDEELVMRIIEQDAQKPEFWQALSERMGDGQFARLAKEIIATLDRILEGFRRENSSEFTTDIKKVRELVADAYAKAIERQGGDVNADEAEASFGLSRRKKEQVGDYQIVPEKDGSFTALGDTAEIRGLMPDGLVGRVVDGGVKFAASDAPRAKAALEGRKLAYSRAGQVVDKLPMKNGKYLGAPPGYDTPAKIPTLRKQLMKLTLEGERGRFWYENSSKAVLRMAGTVDEARRFVALLAIYPPQAKVDTNSTFALRAWAQYKSGQPINVKTRVMDQKATDAMRDVDAFWSGEKTGNFFNNLLREIDPSTAGKQGATIDMWMMRAGMYPNDAPTKTQYAFMENENNRIAAELGWEPQQVQAAIWVAMKARMENPGVKKRTEDSSEKKGWIRFDIKVDEETGKKKKVRVILDKQRHRDNWLKHAMEHTPTAADTQAAKFDFEDGLMRHIGQISFEARPGRSTGVMPGIHDAPYAQQVEFQQAVQRALFDERGVDMLAVQLGLLVDSDILAPGVWQGDVSPSTQLSVSMAPDSGKVAKNAVDPAQAKALNVYAAVLGLLTKQEGVSWHRPFYATTKREANGLEIDIGRPVNPSEAVDVEKAVESFMKAQGKPDWADDFGLISSPKGIRLVNYGVITNDILQTELLEAVSVALPDGKARMFKSDGALVKNNWKESSDGQDYVGRIRAEGRSDVLEWTRGVLAPRVQAVFDEFAEANGWGDPGRISFSEQRGAGSGQAAAGPLAASERAAEEALTPLPGAPSVRGFTGPDPRLVRVAEEYARSIGITLRRQSEYVKVDPERDSRIAQAYEAMPHAPQDPAVREAYENLIRQTTAQYRALERAGYKFWFVDLGREDNLEYISTPWNAMRDIRANQEMGMFPTEEGFGTDASFDPSTNPLLADTGIMWPSGSVDGPMKRVLANDLFRAVHDAFGHGLEGSGFRADGEENAWQAHVRLFTGSAVGAITSETRGQNSWLNYGPYGEKNRTAKVEDTVFADQKTGLMPEWTWTEGRAGDMVQPSAQRDIGAELQARVDNDFDALVKEYAGLPKTDGGRIIGADLARELSPEYRADRTRAAEVHEAVSDFTMKLLERRLNEQRPGTVFLMAGGGGAGKSSADYLVGSEMAKAHTILDGTLSSPDKAREIVRAAMSAGNQVRVVYVYRDPVDAFANGVLPRAMSTGRTVPLDALVKGHAGSAKTVRMLQAEFGSLRKFELLVVDNTRGEGEATLSSLENITNVVSSGLKERFQDEAAKQFRAGKISEAVYLASNPTAADSRGGAEGSAGGRRDDQGRAGSLPQGGGSARSGYSVSPSVQRTPLGFYSELANQLERGPARAPADQWKAFLKGLPGKGVKADEIEWSGIEDWLQLQTGKVPKEDVLAYVNANGVQVEETVLGRPLNNRQKLNEAYERAIMASDAAGGAMSPTYIERLPADQRKPEEQALLDAWNAVNADTSESWLTEGDQPKYGRYTLPGGENYREVLLTLPEDKGITRLKAVQKRLEELRMTDSIGAEFDALRKEEVDLIRGGVDKTVSYKSSHWDQPNIVAHIRVNDRTDADGKRVLFVEELQSDWGQEGKKKGFASPETKRIAGTAVPDDFGGWKVEWEDGTFSGGYDEPSARAKAAEGKSNAKSGVPTAPFVTKTDGWLNLALKRVMIMAAEGGYDRVAFVTGDQSAERYDLSKSVQSLGYDPKSGRLQAFGPARDTVIDKTGVKPEELEDYVGKEVASKLLATDLVMGKHLLDGEQLKVGGEGMKSFYNVIVPNAVKGLLKKLGGGQMANVVITQRDPDGYRLDPDMDEFGNIVDRGVSLDSIQPGFTITDSMREKVQAGVPMFSVQRNQTETPEFKAWFGDSKVVDAEGRPMVVYHGTHQARTKFTKAASFFTDSPANASQYAEDRAMHRGRGDSWFGGGSSGVSGALIQPVYLSMAQPLIVDAQGQNWAAIQFEGEIVSTDQLVEIAKARGSDGLIVRNVVDTIRGTGEPATTYAVFRPEQIKSATGNRGTFDADNPDIRASVKRGPINGQNFTLPPEGKWMSTRRALQDYFIRVREVQDALITQGGKVGEAQDVYRAEERMYGRVQEQMLDFANKVVRPLAEKAGKAKIDLDELSLYAYAMHAKERNADIAAKNQRFPDGGSGMKDAEADAILAKFKAEGKDVVLKDLHNDLMSITQSTRIVLLDEGLISQDEFDAMQSQYSNYVPLRGFEEVDEDGKRVLRTAGGKGFNVRGAETMKALGRASRAGNILENIVSDYERAVVRAERNNVGKAFLDLVTTNPDPDLWEIDAVRTSRTMDRSTGQVVTSKVIDKGENTIAVKVGGKEVYVRIHDPLLLRAMRMAYKDDTGTVPRWLHNTLGLYTAWMRNVLTRYNVAFSAVNAVRDAQAGAVATLDELGGEGVKLYGKYYAQAMAASFRNETGRLDQNARAMDRYFEEFRAAGGTTGGFFMRDADEIRNDMRAIMVAAGASPKDRMEALRGSKAGAGVRATLRALEILGSTSENAARVAAYRAARELGRTPAEAASIAKNLTTNFNRKGEWGMLANSLYLFFNAAVQGSARVIKALGNRRVQYLMAGTAATAMGLALMAAGMGDDDDGESYWDKIPDFEKERNLIIMLPPGLEMDGATKVGTRGRYIKIPMPYGFNVFPVLGYQLADVMRYAGDRNRGASPGRAAVRMVSAIAGSYNPLGGAVDVTDPIKLGMALSPTAGDLFIQLSAGVNPFGDPVGQFKSPYDNRPDSEIAGPRQAGSASQYIARWLNEVTGGNAGRSGAIDVQPATIENLGRTFGGGAGDFLWSVLVNLPVKAMTPEAEIKNREIPIYKAFVGSVDGDTDVRKFYERRAEVLDEFKAAKREQDLGVNVVYDEKSKALQALGKAAESVTREMSALRKEEVRIADDTSMTKGEKAIKRRELEKLRQQLALDFNRQYVETMRGVNNDR